MPSRLVGVDSGHTYLLRDEGALLVGRGPGSDIPIVDPSVSRRHAELVCEGDRVRIRDLGSVNGTFVNGARVEAATAGPGDVVAFGRASFRVGAGEPARPAAELSDERAGEGAASIVQQRPVRDRRSRVTLPLQAVTEEHGAAPPPDEPDLNARKLALLLEASKGLARAVDVGELLDTIAAFVFQIMDVDRAAILLADEGGELTAKVSRDRWGATAARAMPRSIARTVMDERVAVLTDNAPEDDRFGGQSIFAQRVRSAMCAPLIGGEGRVLGVLYVDNLTATQRFTGDDLDFLIAFSGIAAVAIENSAYAERIRREALVRSNFERYFAPALAARIAQTPGAVKLGGEKRTIVVLFSDIRGFTPLSAAMRPDDVATLLSEYFTAMVDCVFRHGGVLDKFIGDSVMAQWGAPIGSKEDPDKAMQAAIEMMDELGKLNAKWLAEGRPALQIGIGINHGEAFAGNIGSERRLEYTVIGDTVNTASRLCSAAGPGEILISEEMVRVLSKKPKLKEMPPMELKNKTQPVKVFKVVE
jgi:adenylate cyclase